MEGILNIDKPPELTSHDVVARVRHILHQRRVGHTGTLDPFATGVLVVLVGRATRLSQFLRGVEKEYEAIIRLGYATDTGDRTGQRVSSPETPDNAVPSDLWTEEKIEKALESLRGEIDQVPPMYSAKKMEGKRLYELARKGQAIDRKPVRVCIYHFTPMRPGGELVKDNLDGTFDFHARVVCSSGTYVRTLAEDLGKLLGVGAHLAELRRTRVGDLDISSAITLEQLKTVLGEEAIGRVLLPPVAALSRLPFVHLTIDDVRRASHGMEVVVAATDWTDGENVSMCDAEGNLIAVGSFDANRKRLHPQVVMMQDI